MNMVCLSCGKTMLELMAPAGEWVVYCGWCNFYYVYYTYGLEIRLERISGLHGKSFVPVGCLAVLQWEGV